MSKITLVDVANLENENSAVAQMAANDAAITAAINNTVSLDGTLPNTMTGNVDFSGGGRILNLAQPLTSQEPLRLADLNAFVGGGTVSNIPAGGVSGAILIKNSTTDYDVSWQPVSPAEIVAGTNISAVGNSPTTISMPDGPTLTNIQNSGTVTFPAATDTLVGRATTDTLSNKTLVAPALGTPTSGVLTNCTSLPLMSITGFGTAVETFLATPTTGNLAAAVTGETGSGALVFGTSPTLVTPILGTPTSGTLTNCTGLPIAGSTGYGSGVAAALANPVTGSGNFVLSTSASLTTPSLGVATATSINKVTITQPASSSALTITNGTLTSTSTVSIGAGQYQGTATNDSATTGNIGEYIESVIATGSAITLTSNTFVNLTSISLTAGDWDISSNASFTSAATTSTTQWTASISTTTGTEDLTNGRTNQINVGAFVSGGSIQTVGIPPVRFSLASTTTVFLVLRALFTVAGQTAYGMIRARRVR